MTLPAWSQADVLAFLHGEAPLDGVWFGEPHPTRKGAYWWRSILREATPSPDPGVAAVEGEVLVTVSAYSGSGKSAVCGEIEILCRALGLDVVWEGGDQEKRLTHADWTHWLETYKPKVRIRELNIPRKGQ